MKDPIVGGLSSKCGKFKVSPRTSLSLGSGLDTFLQKIVQPHLLGEPAWVGAYSFPWRHPLPSVPLTAAVWIGWHLSQVQSNCTLVKNLQWPQAKNVSCHQALELGSTARRGPLTPFNPVVETNWKQKRENPWGEVRTMRGHGSLKRWGGRKWALQKLRGCICTRASLVAQMEKNLPVMRETRVWSLSGEEPLEEGMATHSSILAWRIPWTEEPVGLQSMWLQRVGLNWVTSTFTYMEKSLRDVIDDLE